MYIVLYIIKTNDQKRLVFCYKYVYFRIASRITMKMMVYLTKTIVVNNNNKKWLFEHCFSLFIYFYQLFINIKYYTRCAFLYDIYMYSKR